MRIVLFFDLSLIFVIRSCKRKREEERERECLIVCVSNRKTNRKRDRVR